MKKGMRARPEKIDKNLVKEDLFGMITKHARSFETMSEERRGVANEIRDRVGAMTTLGEVAKWQPETGLLGKKVEEELSARLLSGNSDFEVAFNTAVGSRIGFDGGFGAWIEIKNKHSREMLADFKIDLIIDEYDRGEPGMTDKFLHINKRYLEKVDGKYQIDEAFFESKEFTNLLKNAEAILRKRFSYKHKLKPQTNQNDESRNKRRRVVRPSGDAGLAA